MNKHVVWGTGFRHRIPRLLLILLIVGGLTTTVDQAVACLWPPCCHMGSRSLQGLIPRPQRTVNSCSYVCLRYSPRSGGLTLVKFWLGQESNNPTTKRPLRSVLVGMARVGGTVE